MVVVEVVLLRMLIVVRQVEAVDLLVLAQQELAVSLELLVIPLH
jgi:hypothetical protein